MRKAIDDNEDNMEKGDNKDNKEEDDNEDNTDQGLLGEIPAEPQSDLGENKVRESRELLMRNLRSM